MLKNDLEHKKLERSFLNYLGKDIMFVLKGGTALMFCYGLDRMSEDLDFDSINPNSSMIKKVDSFCKKYDYDYVIKKDTETVQRCNIHVSSNEYLKIETSYRKSNIDDSGITVVNGIKTYTIDFLANFKANAYAMRDTIRDLYDISFIINNFWDSLSDSTKRNFQDILSYKGLEQYDYVIHQQKDALVDNEKMLKDFLRAYDRLNIKSEYKSLSFNAKSKTSSIGSPDELFSNAKDRANELSKSKQSINIPKHKHL